MKDKITACMISAFLTVIPLTGIVSHAETTADGLEYYVYDKGSENYIVITGCSGNSKELVIPSEIDGLPVEEIGDSAFKDNTYLESLKLSDSVKTIKKDIVENCTSLKYIYLGMIDDYPDMDTCTSLENIEYSEANENYVSYGPLIAHTPYEEDEGKIRLEYFLPNTFADTEELTVLDEYCRFYGGADNFPNLKSVTLGAGFYMSDAFIGLHVYQFSGLINSYSLMEINVSEDNPYMASSDGVLFTKNYDTLVKIPYAAAKDAERLRFPEYMRIIDYTLQNPSFSPLEGFTGIISAVYGSPAYEYADKYKFIHSGDIDKNKSVNKKDITLLNNYLLGSEKLDSDGIYLSDMNGDSTVDVFDMITMRKAIPDDTPLQPAYETVWARSYPYFAKKRSYDFTSAWNIIDYVTTGDNLSIADLKKKNLSIADMTETSVTLCATGTCKATLVYVYTYTDIIGQKTETIKYDVEAYKDKNVLKLRVTEK